jgi:hypothetical protein
VGSGVGVCVGAGGERERERSEWESKRRVDGGNYIFTSKDATETTDSYSTKLPYDFPIPSAIRY